MEPRRNEDIAFLLGGGLMGLAIANLPQGVAATVFGTLGLLLILSVLIQRYLDDLPPRVRAWRLGEVGHREISGTVAKFDVYLKRAVTRGIWVVVDRAIGSCGAVASQRRDDGTLLSDRPVLVDIGGRRAFIWVENGASRGPFLKTKISVELETVAGNVKLVRIKPVRWWQSLPSSPTNDVKKLAP